MESYRSFFGKLIWHWLDATFHFKEVANQIDNHTENWNGRKVSYQYTVLLGNYSIFIL